MRILLLGQVEKLMPRASHMPRASWVVVLWCAAAEVHYVPIGHGCWPANVLRLRALCDS